MLNLLYVLDVNNNIPEENNLDNINDLNDISDINENIEVHNQENIIIENENQDEEKDIITSEIESNIDEELPYSKNDDIPIVGIDDLEKNENISDTKFKEGDKIYNKKYGNGTIEKILKCNDKYLFSIQFDKHGRKLLNPQLANIKVIE